MQKVLGHKIAMAGAAYPSDQCVEPICLVSRPGARIWSAEKGGHGTCECGAQSPHLWSKRERQQWHRMHKTHLQVVRVVPMLVAADG